MQITIHVSYHFATNHPIHVFTAKPHVLINMNFRTANKFIAVISKLSIDHSPFKLNLHLCNRDKNYSFTTARKSLLKLIKLPSFVANYCKVRKIYACEVCTFCIFLYYATKALPQMAEIHRNWSGFSVRNTKILYNISPLTFLGNFTNPRTSRH